MAALPLNDRRSIWARLMRRWSALREPCAFGKSDLLAAIEAIDDWIDANATAINQALPQPFRSGATAEQKALLFSYVALKRYGDDGREA